MGNEYPIGAIFNYKTSIVLIFIHGLVELPNFV